MRRGTGKIKKLKTNRDRKAKPGDRKIELRKDERERH